MTIDGIEEIDEADRWSPGRNIGSTILVCGVSVDKLS